MNTPYCYEPSEPTPLQSPWLNVTHDGRLYTPHLVRIRVRNFPVRLIRELDVRRHGHKHPIYHLVYFDDGDNTILVDNRSVDVHANQLVMINPNVFHNVIPRVEHACAFRTLMFSYLDGATPLTLPFNRLLECLTGATLHHSVVVDDPDGRLRAFFDVLETDVLLQTRKRERSIAHVLAGLFNALAHDTRTHASERLIPEDVLLVQRHLITHLDEPVTIQDLTRIANLSRSRLIDKFKAHCGLSPIDFLLHHRIERAKTYLRHSSKRIKEIAWICGFNSEHYFSKTFKVRTGQTPSAFRRSGGDTEG